LTTAWPTVPFGQLYTGPSRNGLNRPKRMRGEGYKMVNMGELFAHDFIADQPMDRVPMSSGEVARFALRRGDLLFARQSLVLEGTGKCSIILAEPQDTTTFESHLIRVRLDQSIADPLFYYYLLRSPQGRGAMQSIVMQVAAAGIRASELATLPLPAPPATIQRKIAAILFAYDELIENNTRRIKLLEEMAQRIYREWFVECRYPGHEEVPLADSEFGPIPQGWTVSPLRESVELLYGKALKADHRRGGDVPVFGSGGRVGFHDQALVDGPGIVVGRKGNVGSVTWSHTSFFPIDTTYYVKTTLPLTYTFFALGRLDFIDSHAAVPGLSREQAYGLPWVTPDANILWRFDQLATATFRLKDCLERTSTDLRATRDLLLPRLVSGEIDVDDLEIQVRDAA
jgi:type I restriction enzyme S subunit